jgi:adenylate kinase
MSKIIVLMGAPGAGKGTQARLIQERLHLPQISTGDILRARAREQDSLAAEIRAVQASGRLAPDTLVIRAVQERTTKEDCKSGYVLDGFPRTTAQASMLEELAAAQGNAIVAIVVDVPLGLLERRTSGRRSCPVCGEIYNVCFKPPQSDETCDQHPGVKLSQRTDDTAEKIRVRLETYDEQTRPLLDYYEMSHRLHRIEGTKQAEEIYQDIAVVIKGDFAS